MGWIDSSIQEVKVFEPRLFHDNRGYFFESFNQQNFEDAIGEKVTFVQDNESVSAKNVLRGLHFQAPPFAQGKLVRVTQGSVLDIAVDIRRSSKTYGEYVAIELSAENKKQLWIPPGFAHGFLALEDNTQFLYKCTAYYSPQHEHTLLFNDTDLDINWNVTDPIISEKDLIGVPFAKLQTPFI
jgi:dTDP-4-dehydrorhamnose 3,5-epimerase